MSIKAMKKALKGFEKIYEGCGFVKEDARFKDEKNVRDLATEVRKDCNKYMEALRRAIEKEKNGG
jgi:GTP cyclohydrolase II